MTEQVLADYSSAHAQITPGALGRVPGCIGGIAYAGCYNTGKNITKAELHALVDAGFLMALVIEDNVADLAHGASWGTSQGQRLVAGAKERDYEPGCVLATGYDTDARGSDYAAILVGFAAFAKVVEAAGFVPGYYGDSDSIDYLHANGYPDAFYWQSESGSFSPKQPTGNAYLWQHYDDSRAHVAGLASSIDVNTILKTPLRFMGEQVALSDADVNKIVHALLGAEVKVDDKSTMTVRGLLRTARESALSAAQAAQENGKQLDSVAQVLGAAKVGVSDRVATVLTEVASLRTKVAALKSDAPSTVVVDVNAIVEGVLAKLPDAVAAKVKSIVWKAN